MRGRLLLITDVSNTGVEHQCLGNLYLVVLKVRLVPT